ncbi:MAG: HAMP domain-containing histidine kinase [Sporocytophaga sp.]|uniref:sensor histidine kinase n=1 Tax=Sporocytophaga sp. TaxID=2231183 RepID=UPI001B20BC81|nr:HAMP domain-containing sensor histidine kinase [Sporocytophaga sp.]MBO9700711.1 HAMP domain-containing histidine kinase [Sporocytophaga sp.]
MEKSNGHIEQTRLSCLIDVNGTFLKVDDACRTILLEGNLQTSSNFFSSCLDKYAKLFTSFLSIVEKNDPSVIILKHKYSKDILEIEWTVTLNDNGNSFSLNGLIRPDFTASEVQNKIQEYIYPIIITDSSLKITSYNKAFEKVNPALSRTIIGMDLKDVLIDKDGNFIHEGIFSTGNCFLIALQLKLNGQNTDYIVSILSVSDHNIITLLPQANSSLKENELKKKEEDINNFIYKVSHDFKGPLTSLNGVLDIAADELKDSAFIPFLNMIRTCSDKLEALITTLLELSRVQATPIVEEATELYQLISELKNEIRKQVPVLYDNVQLSIPDAFPTFTTDVRVFRIALKHLLLNAFVFQKKTRQQPIVELKISKNNSAIEFEVIDNGLGIAENKMERVFEMFYKGSDYSVGTGMGLYLAKVAIQRLSGELILKSKLDEGTRAIIKLPQS